MTQKFGSWVSGRVIVIIRHENGTENKIEWYPEDPLDSENDSSMPRSFLLLISTHTTQLTLVSS